MNNPANIIARTTENCIDLRTLYKFKGNYTFVVTAVNRFRQEVFRRWESPVNCNSVIKFPEKILKESD